MSRRGAALFAAMCVIWGIPYLLIKVSVEEVTPEFIVLVRTGLGALVLLPLALHRRLIGELRARWPWVVAFTVIEMAIPWLLLGHAEQHLTSSVTGLLLASIPLVAVGISRRFGQHEQLGTRRLLGLLIGVAGVVALVGIDVGSIDLPSVGLLAVVAVCYAVGPMIQAARLADVPPLGVVAASVSLCALIYLPVGTGRAPEAWPSAQVVASLVGLALICTALAFIVFFALIGELGPVRATVITYVNPAVAIALGVAILDEQLTGAMVVGFVLVLVGSVLATSRPVRPTDHPQPIPAIADP